MVTIKISKDSELSQRIQAALDSGEPLFVDNGEQVVRLDPSDRAVAVEDTEDIWAGYDPEVVRESLRRTAGALSVAEADAWKAMIYQAREAGTRPEREP